MYYIALLRKAQDLKSRIHEFFLKIKTTFPGAVVIQLNDFDPNFYSKIFKVKTYSLKMHIHGSWERRGKELLVVFDTERSCKLLAAQILLRTSIATPQWYYELYGVISSCSQTSRHCHIVKIDSSSRTRIIFLMINLLMKISWNYPFKLKE